MLKDLVITKEKFDKANDKAKTTKEYWIGYEAAIKICEKNDKKKSVFRCPNCQNESFLYKKIRIKKCPICQIDIK